MREALNEYNWRFLDASYKYNSTYQALCREVATREPRLQEYDQIAEAITIANSEIVYRERN